MKSAARRMPWALVAFVLLAAPVWSDENKPADTAVATPKSVAELKSLEGQIKKVVEKALPATVGVRIGSSFGSGVIVSEEGLVLTAAHVSGKPGENVVFYLSDGRQAKGKTLGMYAGADAGMMKITDEGKWPYLERGKSADVALGAWCVATGHPMGYQKDRPPVVRVGRVIRKEDRVIQSDCALVGGDSGGPLVNLKGQIIGIHSRIGLAMEVNLHVPIDVFEQHWKRLLEGHEWNDLAPARDGPEIARLFDQLATNARRCTVRVGCDGRDAALGTIVGPDGWIVTKASELRGKITCTLSDNRQMTAKIVGISEPFDLAMLKIEATDLPEIAWSTQPPAVGQWLSAPCFGPQRVAVGVMSVPPRDIPPVSGVLGVALTIGDPESLPRLEKIYPDSPAERAGLRADDIVTHVDGRPIKTLSELVAGIRGRRIGSIVRLNVRRGDRVLAVPVKIGTIDTPGAQRRDLQNHSGVGISKRHDDFPAVLQHDIVLSPNECGGPLVDLSGKVVGVNIARGGRTETYGIPTATVLEQMYDLMSGRLNPKAIAAAAAAKKKATSEKVAAEKAVKEEAERAKKAAEEKAAQERADKSPDEDEKPDEEEKAEAEPAPAP